MSACEINGLTGGFDSPDNRRRKELDRKEWHGYRVGEFVKDESGRVGRIHRFVESGPIPATDIRWWRPRPDSANRKLLEQVDLLTLEIAEDPRKEDDV